MKQSYSETGRPSIDPELLLRILLIGYLYGITSERKLVEELRMHLAWRWFTGLGFDQEIPRTRREEREEASDRRHRKKAGGAAASPVGERRSVRTGAQQQPNHSGGRRIERKTKQKSKPFQEEKRQSPKPSSGDCVNRLARVPLEKSRTTGR